MIQVAYDYESERSSPDERGIEQKSYELPDGKVIELSKQAVYRAGEVIFDPKIVGANSMSIV